MIIKLELRNSVEANEELKNKTIKIVIENLQKLNSEYRKLYSMMGGKATPQIDLMPFGNEMFVVKASKHKWVKR